ncbi:MAG: hypothetical protein QOE05_1633 [Actinomycetota bacterium]|jgi:hypothetical protein|nr:hypothetical protein [Actinomycetota bacterium]
MGGQTVMIVPATVPCATVLRTERLEPAAPVVVSADPAVVPVARPTRLVSDVLTSAQVAQLRAENADLRAELERVHAR